MITANLIQGAEFCHISSTFYTKKGNLDMTRALNKSTKDVWGRTKSTHKFRCVTLI